MWSSVATSAPQVTPVVEKVETAADLNASLLACVGEENHKTLRKMCGRLQRNDMKADDFHQAALELFKSGEGQPMATYRRLVLSFPDGDKRAHLVSLCDEAVATEKENAVAAASAAPVNPTVEASPQATDTPTPATEVPVAAVSPVDADAGVATQNVTAIDGGAGLVEKTGGAKEAATKPSPEASAAAIVETKAKVESTEKAILTVMARRQQDLAKEKRALDLIRSEMATVVQQQSNEIQGIMTQLGETDKDLWYVERDFKAAELEYLRCKKSYDKMKSEKDELVSSLTSLTLNAEKKKEAKLNSIMEKLRNDGVVFPGAALANIADP
mmetsp:Transcript_69387/g.136452  ORF Transcript_69387/g.136452 Transcript_69387/m.136452 type:complete len:328 (+) Transcript_69387:52-1035(+)